MISVRSEVQILPGPPCFSSLRDFHRFGGIAQLGERLLCKQEVVGSIPSASTIRVDGWIAARFEDRWKEPQHGIRGQAKRESASLAPLSATIEAGSWTSEDEVQVTEDSLGRGKPWLGHASKRRRDRVCDERVCSCAWRNHLRLRDQASEGHLVDALALRGDEGRSTLR